MITDYQQIIADVNIFSHKLTQLFPAKTEVIK